MQDMKTMQNIKISKISKIIEVIIVKFVSHQLGVLLDELDARLHGVLGGGAALLRGFY